MVQLRCEEIPKLIDVSGVRTDVTYDEIKLIAKMAKKYGFICAFVMPCFTEKLKELLAGSDTMLGGVTGFPSGADTTEEKVACAIEMKRIGCDEIDMVINVGALKSGDYDLVDSDIRAVVNSVKPTPVKSILEIAYLTDEEIAKGCEIAVKAGVTFVKSGTGWAGKPTTTDTIRIMKSAVGANAKIKAAGGVRTLKDLEAMYDEGCTRFGISIKSALSILKEAYERDGKEFPDSELVLHYDVKKAIY